MAGLGLAGPLAVDANLLGYMYFGEYPERQMKSRAAMVEAREFGIQVSTVTLSELLVRPQRLGGRTMVSTLFATISTTPGLKLVPLAPEWSRLVAEIRVTHGLKLPDAIILASAVSGGADLLLTNDRQLFRAAESRLRAVYFDDWQP
ncbi:MAG: type II toxin-antitoxin system VapC family toxin [Dehalococcoidia bacterium]